MLDVEAGSESTTVTGEVTALLRDGSSQVLTIDPVVVPAEGSVTVSACASADASTADPSISDLSVRDLPVRGLGGILGVVLGLVDTVVGILGHGGAGGGLLGS